MEKYQNSLLNIFLTFLKLGLFSFGGGTTMLSLLKDELVDKKNWIDDSELLEITAISESTPGPIAINLATYLGYKKHGVLGSIVATLGIVLPAFIIMFLLSILYQYIKDNEVIKYAFVGIECGVIYLVLRAGINLLKGIDKNWLSIALFLITTTLIIIFSIFNINYSSIYFILGGLLIGLVCFGFLSFKVNNKRNK